MLFPTVLSTLLRECLSCHVSVEGLRIPRLQEDRPRTGELADKTFARSNSADDASRSDAFHDILAIPCDQIAIVDDIAFALNQLPGSQQEGRDKEEQNIRLS